MENQWSKAMNVAQIRVARPTNQLKVIEHFYCKGICLMKVGSFRAHNGYNHWAS
ncbi:hypothetical protein BACCIP111883_01813 [Sutcliffiella rhizosphaerae]|uniref:YycE-like N-terminal domain-containing protein n=1 Tax=Sutcliffiella rhizosphaerae TaxID=2880967 RepID=A0ABN8A9F6_9BACI|nr:hypothetical protein BACCIP111883_01813 [Sutcliffiella rhizosphaerae]